MPDILNHLHKIDRVFVNLAAGSVAFTSIFTVEKDPFGALLEGIVGLAIICSYIYTNPKKN